MEDFKLYSVSDEYIQWLRRRIPNVYSNKADGRVHTRKYLGAVLKIKEYYYYIPLSSPKESDYQIAGGEKIIKKSIIPIMRIVVKNSRGQNELKGTLRISHMIPVPVSELTLYDIESEKDTAYKDLIHNEIIFIRKNKHKIASSAQLLYKQKTAQDNSVGYVKTALDYKQLEELCDEFDVNNYKKVKV